MTTSDTTRAQMAVHVYLNHCALLSTDFLTFN